MIAGLQVNLQPITQACLAAGGHIRTGLEDATFYASIGNLQLVEQAAKTVRNEHFDIGTAAQFRQYLKST